MDEPVRKIIHCKHFFTEFSATFTPAVQRKIEYVLDLIRHVPHFPAKFLKHMEGTEGIFEVRVEFQSNIYRVFCFFDKGRLVILLNGFQKKSQKTPGNEIELAERLK